MNRIEISTPRHDYRIQQLGEPEENSRQFYFFIDGFLMGQLLWRGLRLGYEPIQGAPTENPAPPSRDLLRAFHTLMVETWALPTEVEADEG